MKKLSIFIASIIVGLSAMAQTEVKSKIEKVTVYPNSALVEKYITVNLQKGENKFIIHNNARDINAGDIHFASSSDWFISSLKGHQSNLLDGEVLERDMPGTAFAQYQALKSQLDEVKLKISNLNILLSILAQQGQAIKNMKAVSNTAAFDTIVNLKAQFEYQRKESQAINTAQVKASKEREELSTKQRQLESEIMKLVRKYTGGEQVLNSQNDIYVSVYSNKNIPNAKIAFAYRSANVSCSYSYDVMMSEVTKDAVFSLKALLFQSTGEHWNDCPVVFSTTESGYAGYDSELPVYYLNYYTPKPAHRTMVAKMARNTVTSMATDAAEVAEEKMTLNTFSTRSNLTLSREYALKAKQTIPSSENGQTLLLQNDTTKVVFSRFATPKNEEKVHFTALLPDWEDLGLLEVGCNVYLNNKYVSMSEISTYGSGDTLRFSVGQDPNVLVKRKYTISTPDKGLLSKEITQTVTITLTIKNTKNEPIELRMKDQVPISSNADIKVLDVNTAGGTIDDKTGVIRWIVPMQALENKTITFSYTLKYPKEKEGSLILN